MADDDRTLRYQADLMGRALSDVATDIMGRYDLPALKWSVYEGERQAFSLHFILAYAHFIAQADSLPAAEAWVAAFDLQRSDRSDGTANFEGSVEGRPVRIFVVRDREAFAGRGQELLGGGRG